MNQVCAMHTALGNTAGAGFGYGAGIEYNSKQFKHFGIGVDYIKYPSITTEIVGLEYDMQITKLFFKYIFLK